MSAMSNYLENKLADFLFRAQAFVPPANLYVALLTAAPDDTSTGATISEVANAGSYARAEIVCGLAAFKGTHGNTTGVSSGTSGQVSNASAVTFPSPTGDWGVVTHFAILDSSTYGAGNVWLHGALTASKTVNNGDAAPQFAADALTATLG